MRSRRQYHSEAVYWPAFADIMTVLVVVLLCTFAAIERSSSRRGEGAAGAHESEYTATSGTPFPGKTFEEYKSAVLENRRHCVLSELRKEGNNTLNNSFQVKLCTFKANLEGQAHSHECQAALDATGKAFEESQHFSDLEATYSLQFGPPRLRATTGLSNANGPIIKDQLKEAQAQFTTLGNGTFSFFKYAPAIEYSEEGPANRDGEMSLIMTTGLSGDLTHKIDQMWKAKDTSGLEEMLDRQSKSCEKIGE